MGFIDTIMKPFVDEDRLKQKLPTDELILLEGVMFGVYGNWLVGYVDSATFVTPILWMYGLRLFSFVFSMMVFIYLFIIGDRFKSAELMNIFGILHIVPLLIIRPFDYHDFLKFYILGFMFWILILVIRNIRFKRSRELDADQLPQEENNLEK